MQKVKTGTTTHVEVYDFEYEGDEQTFENLVKHFFMIHDPTRMNRQEEDVGTQYASAIYVYDDIQVTRRNCLVYSLAYFIILARNCQSCDPRSPKIIGREENNFIFWR